ncbi:MAG: hypothetical protein UR93_C0024G0002 [Berkelbacteria bacterium GW2011_GWA2_35_9]|uniref:Uncharacterized protein n=1 Tax=Berkelbacteria bacterium GW2011_GWA2_35_9 TaxID=1618333 RepID=A0A0G0D3T5_9BACT|nr:MAG: hypothetical protein UR93_C0024G0002 [Berkelbacteria bacterium GW2011_GWA2_35_9]
MDRILTFIIALGLGLVIIIYTKQIVDMAGNSQWAESKLGAGGTYTFWKLFGLLVILMGFLYAIGTFN